MVWFGEGIDYDTDNPFTPDSNILRETMKEAIDEATRAGVSFYGVDARGLGAGLDEAIDIGGLPADDPYFNSPSTAIQNEVRRAQDSMRVLSEETGGFAIINQNDFNTGFQRIIEDNSSYYVLGYYPTNDKRDGRFRKVEVRVTRPGVKVQARNGYTAPKGKPAAATAKSDPKVPPEILDALANPIPAAGVGLSMFAAPFVGPGSKASVALAVEFAPSTLRFVEQNGKFNEDIELHVLAIDASGKMQDGGPTTVPLRLSAANHERRGRQRLPRAQASHRCRPAVIRSASPQRNRTGTRGHRDSDRSMCRISPSRRSLLSGIAITPNRRSARQPPIRIRSSRMYFPGRPPPAAIFRAATRWRSLPRSTTTNRRLRIASPSPAAFSPTMVVRCSPPPTNDRATNCRERKAATAIRANCRSAIFRLAATSCASRRSRWWATAVSATREVEFRIR